MEISANELRIGNYVEYKCIPMEIDIPIYKIECGADIQIHQNHNYFKPIPLTEDWLKKFGFKKIAIFGTNEKSSHYWQKNGFQINNENGYWFFKDSINIKYVHQLQNLYWCLCEKELQKHL